MSLQVVVAILFGAFASVGWAMVGRYSDAHPAWVGFVIMGLSGLWVAVRDWSALGENEVSPRQLLILIIAAVINGEAVYRIAVVMADPPIRGSVFPLAIAGTSMVSGLLLGWILLREIPTTVTFLSVLCVLIGVLGLLTQIHR